MMNHPPEMLLGNNLEDVTALRRDLNSTCNRRTRPLAILYPLAVMLVPLCLWNYGHAETAVIVEVAADTNDFGFKNVPPPAVDDAGAKSDWHILRGFADPNGATISALFDGVVPQTEDSPKSNFFFSNQSTIGSIGIDLGSEQSITQVAAYSWHSNERAPQVYTLYGRRVSNKNSEDWKNLAANQSPESAGWTRIISVDTNYLPEETEGYSNGLGTRIANSGGQHASLISNPEGSIGHYRYLLLDCEPSVADHPFGRTFFSEIDVLTTETSSPKRIEALKRESFDFESEDGRYQFTIDTTAAPSLKQWSEQELKPVVKAWYPRIVEMLPSEDFEAPQKVSLRFLPDSQMRGIPAYAQNNRISMNTEWYTRELKREALGATVHELVHVVQQYGSNGNNARNQTGRRSSTPGWITEGIPDYIRWFLYEPGSKGALLSGEALSKAKHDASYRISANFLDYVNRKYGKENGLISALNSAAREGRYSSETWKVLTGKPVDQLEQEWRRGE